MLISRRGFIKGIGLAGLSAALPWHFAFADTPGGRKLLVVILRGAMDGLAAVVPVGDKTYADARGPIAMPQNAENLTMLDNYFAMHKGLTELAQLFQQKQLAVMHAVATPYRERSHFDAQNLLENGTDKPNGLNTGWLNRAVGILQSPEPALALGPTIPLILRGEAKTTSWAPSNLPTVDDDFMNRVRHMYDNDPTLLNALTEAQGMQSDPADPNKGSRAFISLMQKAASFMVQKGGQSIGTIDIGGWDTHANQGLDKGRLANNFRILAQGLDAYRLGMGAAWKETAVLVITEFGRTVRGNGSGGTDHGTGSVAFLLGGSVNGGRVVGEWPGLGKLYQDRDLIPANDLRSLLKGTLTGHLGIPDNILNERVFPGANSVAASKGLFTYA